MPNTKSTSSNRFFWDKFIASKNVDLPELPQNYRSDNGAFLIDLTKQQADRLVVSSDGIFPDKWITAKTIDGAIFAYPDVDNTFDLSNPMNYGSAKSIDAQTLGIIVSMMVYSIASFQFEPTNAQLSAVMGDNYHSLRNSFYGFLDTALYPDEVSETGDDEQIARLSLFADATDAEKESLSEASSAIYSITD